MSRNIFLLNDTQQTLCPLRSRIYSPRYPLIPSQDDWYMFTVHPLFRCTRGPSGGVCAADRLPPGYREAAGGALQGCRTAACGTRGPLT